MDLKAVQVVIAPTEGALQCLVELRHRAVGSDEKPPPYQRADAAQDYPQLKDLRFGRLISPISRAYSCAPHTPNFQVGLLMLATRPIFFPCTFLQNGAGYVGNSDG